VTSSDQCILIGRNRPGFQDGSLPAKTTGSSSPASNCVCIATTQSCQTAGTGCTVGVSKVRMCSSSGSRSLWTVSTSSSKHAPLLPAPPVRTASSSTRT
jgi:hypothetical protein